MRNKSLVAIFILGVAACSCNAASPSDGRRSIDVHVNASGYEPAEVTAHPGEQVRLVFTRTTDEGCGQQVVFPDLNIRRDLPLDEPVAVDITMPATGAVSFTCGMNMFRGSVVAR